jgi:predicted XRE-type DNA-binding protein
MSSDVFADLGFNEEESAGLNLKSCLFISLQEVIKASKMTQAQVAEALGTDQPKVSKIMNGKLSEFSLERVLSYLQKLGFDIEVSVRPGAGAIVFGGATTSRPVAESGQQSRVELSSTTATHRCDECGGLFKSRSHSKTAISAARRMHNQSEKHLGFLAKLSYKTTARSMSVEEPRVTENSRKAVSKKSAPASSRSKNRKSK